MLGVVLCRRKENEVVAGDDRYRFGHDVADYLKAAFTENKAIRAIWDNNRPLEILKDEYEREGDPDKSHELLRQAAEYFVLDHLSGHVRGYFARRPGGDLVVLRHTDIPEVLLQNRFLKLFSEPIEERAPF